MTDIEKDLKALAEKQPLDMTAVMTAAEKFLPELLQDKSAWQSLMIDYQPPHLMRLFRQIGDVRVNLHYFLPTAALPETRMTDAYDENLYHPHAWASGMRILEGEYEQWMGFAERRGTDAVPPKTLHLLHTAGDSYAMNHPWIWHQVIPAENKSVSTLMVTYIPKDWDQDVPKSSKQLRCLNQQEIDFMFDHFPKFYPAEQKAAPAAATKNRTPKPGL